MDVSCAIDLGTSAVKVLLVDAAGQVQARAAAGYPVRAARPGWAETETEDWRAAVWSAIAEAQRQSPASRVVTVGLDGQMHGLVLSAAGRAVRPALLWPDTRAEQVAEDWQRLDEPVLARLANPVAPGMYGPLLEWLLHHEPALLARAEVALPPKDWLRSAVLAPGSDPVTEPSDASATLLWDAPADDWHRDLARLRGLPQALLPRLRRPSEAVARTGSGSPLPSGLPVATGAADTAATLAGLQLASDEVLVNLGTGTQVCQSCPAPEPTAYPDCHHYADAHGGHYAMVAPQNGGLVLQRVLQLLGADWDELYAALDQPDPGSVRFSPWLTSDRLPRRPGQRAGWSGIGLDTSRADLLRAALEAVAFQVRAAVARLPRRPGRIRFAGGGARDQRMRQLVCDLTGLPGRRSAVVDATALGAARLGWEAAGADLAWEPAVAPGLTEPRPAPGLLERSEQLAAETAG